MLACYLSIYQSAYLSILFLQAIVKFQIHISKGAGYVKIVYVLVSLTPTGHLFGELAKLLMASRPPCYYPWIHILLVAFSVEA